MEERGLWDLGEVCFNCGVIEGPINGVNGEARQEIPHREKARSP